MSHQIHLDELKGTSSFVSYGEKAWHGLGQVVDKAMTASECIELANLDYEVAKTTVHAEINNPIASINETGEMSESKSYEAIEDKFATYRTDTNKVLGIVGSRYEIIQNKDAFGFFDAIIDSGEAIFETAGALGRGERIFVTAKLPDDLLVGGEVCNKYIILTNSHDGTTSIIAGFTTIRVVCNNTLQAALRGLENKVSIKHRAGAKERLSEAYRVMGIGSKYMTEIEGIFNRMAETKMEDTNLKSYIKDVMISEYKAKEVLTEAEKEAESTRFKNQVNSIYEFALSHPTQQTDATRGTVWGAYNAISAYYNHILKYSRGQEQKFTSQFFGSGYNKINKGFTKALELI
jgi:phage/plasmid-like protein (TIGR03299 family)